MCNSPDLILCRLGGLHAWREGFRPGNEIGIWIAHFLTLFQSDRTSDDALAARQRNARQQPLLMIVRADAERGTVRLFVRCAGRAAHIPAARFRRALSQALRSRGGCDAHKLRPAEHTYELKSLMRISSAVFCLNKKYRLMFIKQQTTTINIYQQ